VERLKQWTQQRVTEYVGSCRKHTDGPHTARTLTSLKSLFSVKQCTMNSQGFLVCSWTQNMQF